MLFPQEKFIWFIVSKVNVHKHLGLILDPKLSLVIHINEKIYKAKKVIGVEKIQYQASLAITGTWQGTSTNKL